ncbi:hypothetical protein BI364_14030 [Acidihalobacter yilgarnensis]|uniref:Uncharacterized protein n=1 Tax=Acidihalobacter yilgarnensis TaxID=2819280 RepID=A0A1D8IRB0_9GAMM|nr:LysE family transporter [Acidihalobacter yilgarnensis]AOU98924.1 hypothetical protein BI364_14030 [Acidihalobacter yilgarnensis]
MQALPARDSWRMFANTYLVTAFNPKGILFFVAFLPQFVSPAAPPTPQLWLLSVTFVIVAAFNAMFYTLSAARMRRWLRTLRVQAHFGRVTGSP